MISMDVNVINKLSDLELHALDGNSEALPVFFNPDYVRLMKTPVQVSIANLRGVDKDLAKIVEKVAGAHICFEYLRHEVQSHLHARSLEKGTIGWMALQVLFNGIYVGDASDILRVRNGNKPLDFGNVQETRLTLRDSQTYLHSAKREYKHPSNVGLKVAEVKFIQ